MYRKISNIFRKNKIMYIMISCLMIYIFLSPGNLPVPAENLDVPSGIATDLVVDKSGNKKYLVTIDVYTFNKLDEIKDILIDGTGINIADTREKRQVKSNHKFVYGLEKVALLSEDFAKHGIENALDILFGNANMNDLAWLVVTKGKAVDILKFKVADYPTSSDYIKGIIDNCKELNFFSEEYKIMDTYVRVGAEGRSLVLPYVEIKNSKIQIGGVALFKKDTMLKALDLEETKYMNFLRTNNVRGILSLQKSFDKQISMHGKVTRKVSCYKTKEGKLIFDMNLEFKGNIVSNSLYKDFLKETDVIHNFEKSLEKDTEKKCNGLIDKMQNEYKIDCLELGRVAAAKYGRGTGVDWDEVVSNSKINIKVKIKVEKFGRGEYTIKSE